MGFIIILILTTLSIAGSAAYFSIYGLAHIFTGAFWPVVIMASSLEAGKLVAASYLYRYWDKIQFLMKVYLISAVMVLMLITSAGIFGYLSVGYQVDILPLEEMKTKVALLEQQTTEYEKLRSEEKLQRNTIQAAMEKEIAAYPGKWKTAKENVGKKYSPKLDVIDQNIQRYTLKLQTILEEKQQLKITKLQQETKTGPIIFIAEAFNQEVDNATKWLILIIIFAFDPLAVILTIGTNAALVYRRQEKQQTQIKDTPQVNNTEVQNTKKFEEVEITEPPLQKESVILSSDDITTDVDDVDFNYNVIQEPEPESEPITDTVDISLTQFDDEIINIINKYNKEYNLDEPSPAITNIEEVKHLTEIELEHLNKVNNIVRRYMKEHPNIPYKEIIDFIKESRKNS
jgi:hypothetical protein